MWQHRLHLCGLFLEQARKNKKENRKKKIFQLLIQLDQPAYLPLPHADSPTKPAKIGKKLIWGQRYSNIWDFHNGPNWANSLKTCLTVVKNLIVVSQRICKYCGFDCLGSMSFHPAHVWVKIMPMKAGRKFLSAASEMIKIQFPSEHSRGQSYPAVDGLLSLGQCHSYGVETK